MLRRLAAPWRYTAAVTHDAGNARVMGFVF